MNIEKNNLFLNDVKNTFGRKVYDPKPNSSVVWFLATFYQ